jgi:hypothetical protein
MFHYLHMELQRVIKTSVFFKWRILAPSISSPANCTKDFCGKKEQKSAIFRGGKFRDSPYLGTKLM